MIGEISPDRMPGAPARAEVWNVPPGVYVPPGSRGNYEIDGLFASTLRPDPGCCWMSPRARIRFTNEPHATALRLTVFVSPDVPIYREKPPTIAVSMDGHVVAKKCCLRSGATELRVPLFDRYRKGVGPYVLEIRTSRFVPFKERMNGDTRTLGLILKKLETL